MAAKPATFDDYLARLPAVQRRTLERIRRTIRAAVPDAEEGLSYGLAAFRLHGKPLAGLGAGADHCAYYPMSGAVIAALAQDLTKYQTSKGTIRFPASQPLPAALVRKLLRARIAEIERPR